MGGDDANGVGLAHICRVGNYVSWTEEGSKMIESCSGRSGDEN